MQVIGAVRMLFCPMDKKFVNSRDCYHCRPWFDADDNTGEPVVVYCKFPKKSKEVYDQLLKAREDWKLRRSATK